VSVTILAAASMLPLAGSVISAVAAVSFAGLASLRGG
jgi:hypothetical protein